MTSYHIGIATANIEISNIYLLANHPRYVFDVTFKNSSAPNLLELSRIQVGFEREIAEGYWNAIKENFESFGISDGSPVSVMFSGNEILAISPRGKDLWFDVRKGICCAIPRSFLLLGINIKSLEVY